MSRRAIRTFRASMRVVKQRHGLAKTRSDGGRRVVEQVAPAREPLLVHGSDPLPCAKVAYPSETAAGVAASRYGQRAYECFCGSWHLTSRGAS